MMYVHPQVCLDAGGVYLGVLGYGLGWDLIYLLHFKDFQFWKYKSDRKRLK